MKISPAQEIDAERHWIRWIMQTARTWDDLADVVKSTDIDILDDDHKKLTELTLEINSLLDASHGGKFSLDAIQKQRHILESIYAYAEHHFHREEELIEKLSLPNAEKQRKQHENFLTMVRTALEDFNHGRLTVSMHLKQWILEWWVHHINELDYQTFGQENMVERVLANPNAWSHLIKLIKPTGVASMDEEHRNLIQVASDWVQTLQAGQDGSLLLRELERCASEHFRDEEELIEKNGLPGLETQRQQHAKFMDKLRGLATNTEPVDGVRLILNWWISHINETDAVSFSVEHLGERILDDSVTWEQLEKFVLSTGVAEIDAEHQRMAEQMLKLDASENIPETLTKIDEMIDFARHHFTHEEALMARQDSPLLRVHADNHLKFLDMILGYRKDLEHGRLKVSKGLKGYLLEWWVRHIREYDVPAFVRSQAKVVA